MYLTGYRASSLERISALVAPVVESRRRSTQSEVTPQAAEIPAQPPKLFVPALELALVSPLLGVFEPVGWTDDDDPLALIASALGSARKVVVSDELWAHHLLVLQRHMPGCDFVSVTDALGGLRSIKTEAEMAAVQFVGGLADEVARQLQGGEIPVIGRTEAEIADDISDRLIAVGHDSVEFCIVASGPNSASPHHHPGDRVVQPDEMLLCDFGGRHNDYCSDITRCVWTGEIPNDVAAAWATLKKAQQAAVSAARPGVALGDVDGAAREIIDQGGFADNFIHRTGHGIGTEVHEEPYVKAGNPQNVEVGHCFSIEPGIYIPGRWGMRLEDIVVISEAGAIRCSTTDHDLVEVTA